MPHSLFLSCSFALVVVIVVVVVVIVAAATDFTGSASYEITHNHYSIVCRLYL